VAAEPAARVVPLHPPAADEARSAPMEHAPRAKTAALAATILRRLTVVMPIINLTCAVITYVFLVYVVPLPGAAPPAQGKPVDLIGSVVGFGICWVVCGTWGTRVARPVLSWLERGGDPDEAERSRALRLPLYEARNTLIVWATAGSLYGAADVAAEAVCKHRGSGEHDRVFEQRAGVGDEWGGGAGGWRSGKGDSLRQWRVASDEWLKNKFRFLATLGMTALR